MEIRPIKSEADYEAALKEIETLMGAETDSPEGDRLDVLVTLVEAYERIHYQHLVLGQHIVHAVTVHPDAALGFLVQRDRGLTVDSRARWRLLWIRINSAMLSRPVPMTWTGRRSAAATTSKSMTTMRRSSPTQNSSRSTVSQTRSQTRSPRPALPGCGHRR